MIPTVIIYPNAKDKDEGIPRVVVFEDRDAAIDFWEACNKRGKPAVLLMAEWGEDAELPEPVPVQKTMF